MNKLKSQFIDRDTDLLPPYDDRIFKTLLTHPDSKQVLIDIISIKKIKISADCVPTVLRGF